MVTVARTALALLFVVVLRGCEEVVSPAPDDPPPEPAVGDIAVKSTPSGARRLTAPS